MRICPLLVLNHFESRFSMLYLNLSNYCQICMGRQSSAGAHCALVCVPGLVKIAISRGKSHLNTQYDIIKSLKIPNRL